MKMSRFKFDQKTTKMKNLTFPKVGEGDGKGMGGEGGGEEERYLHTPP